MDKEQSAFTFKVLEKSFKKKKIHAMKYCSGPGCILALCASLFLPSEADGHTEKHTVLRSVGSTIYFVCLHCKT